MTCGEIMKELEKMGSGQIKKILMKHGAREPLFGVRVEDLKKIQKKVKMEYQLALDLYNTGNADAMYLAGLIADDKKMTKKDLQNWVEQAYSPQTSEFTVPWVASESEFGMELALEWIESKKNNIRSSGWATLSALVSIKPDSELDIQKLKWLLQRVEKTIHTSPNRVRYAMNGFVIAVGSFVPALTVDAIAIAKKIGDVTVDMGGTACKVPSAADYILKVKDKGTLGKKRKTAKC